MPTGNDRVKTKGCSLDVVSDIKKSIVDLKANLNCLAYALLINMLMVTPSTNHIGMVQV